MSLENWTWGTKYPVFIEDEYKNRTLREAVSIQKKMKPVPFIWSARLSSGIFGLRDCPSGNALYAPKGQNEIVWALGDQGLEELIDIGFLPCPVCHPENTPGFWEKADGVLKRNLGASANNIFLDRSIIPFDASRIDWYVLAPFLTSLPNRLYVPPSLDEDDLLYIKDKMGSLGFKIPPVGYYDRTSPTRFTEYNLDNVA